MADIFQSLKTKFELVMICIALLGMISTGIYVYHDQTTRLNTHERDIHNIKNNSLSQEASTQAIKDVMNATIIPSLNSQAQNIVVHGTRLDTMEKNARADREILIEIRNDLKWMVDRINK